MKTWRTKMAEITVMIAAHFLILLFLVSGAQAKKYGTYRFDGKKLTAQEQYVLEQTEKGKIANLLELIPDQDLREQIGKLGLAAYVEQLNDKDREAFLEEYGDRLLIRPRFLGILVVKGFGFPGFKIDWHGVRIENALIKDFLDFEAAEVEHSFSLSNSILQGGVTFMDSYFKKTLFLSGSRFQGEANFGRVKVGKSLFMKEAHFSGPVIFVIADIGADLEANEAQFLNGEDPKGKETANIANFNGMKVGNTVFFKETTFQGPVDFSFADIKGNFEADGAKFLNAKDLNGNETSNLANFSSMEVGNTAFFREANFQGPVDFSFADIKGNFEADGAEFHYKDTFEDERHKVNIFEGIKIGRYAFFRKVIFNGKAVFAYGNFSDLFIYGSEPIGENEPAELDLAGLMVHRDLEIKNMKIGSLKAANCQVKGRATFAKVEWPGKDKVNLAGLSCQSMEMDKPPPTGCWDKVTARLLTWLYPHDRLLDLIDNSDSDTTTYLNLAAFFQRTSQKDLADQTYIKMKQKESGLDSWWDWLNPWKWPELLFWDLPVGYGRKPLRILGYALIFIGVGACLFNPIYLTKVKWPKRSKFFGVLGRLALSCDICTPSLLNLGLEQDWSPPRPSTRMKILIFLYGLVGRIFIAVFFLGVWEKFK